MSYSPEWTHQDGAGHVAAGDFVHAADVNELLAPINRRLKLMFNPGWPVGLWPVDFAVAAGQAIASSPISAGRGAVEALVPAGSYFVHDAGWYQLSLYAQWLYPQAGPDENKIIVRDGKPPAAGEVGFFAKLNGGANWTGGVFEAAPAAVHINELRDAGPLLLRGRYFFRAGDGGSAQGSKDLPGGLWYPPAVARDGGDELHSWFGGRDWLWPADGAGGYFGTRGQQVTVRGATMRLQPQGSDARIKLYRCKRNVNTSNFSWTQYDADAGLAWASPGGAGSADAELIDSFALTSNTWTQADLTGLVQQMADGLIEPTFMVAPDEETGWPDEPTHILVELTVDFDLDCPEG